MAVKELDIKLLRDKTSGGSAIVEEISRWNRMFVYLPVLAIGAFYLLTIRQGHDWGDDFSLYIQHAKNIAEGVSYKFTNYLHFAPYVGPEAYPPIFPLFLAPIYKLFGLNLTAMKVGVIVTFLTALLIFIQIIKTDLSQGLQVALITVIGLNPYFWDLKDQIMSDIPFMVPSYLSIYLVYKAYQSDATGLNKLLFGLAIGVILYLSYGTRSVGLVLVASFALGDLWRNKKITLFGVGVTALAGVLMLTQSYMLRNERSYYDQFQADSQNFLHNWLIYIVKNLVTYTSSLTLLWDNGYSKLFRIALTMVVSLLAVIGFFARVRREVTMIEIFMVIYPILIIVVPMEGGIRYMVPIIPFYIFFAVQGVMALPLKGFGRNTILAVLGAAVFLTYAAKYTKEDFKQIPSGISKAETVQLFDYINHQAQQSDVFIFTKPRALALFTGRKSSFYPMSLGDKKLWDYFHHIKATHVIVGPPELEPFDQSFLTNFVEKYESSLQEVYSNADFKVYQIVGTPNPSGTVEYIRPRRTDPPPQND
jgi:hypothetical protein